jgi:hypothetical protein
VLFDNVAKGRTSGVLSRVRKHPIAGDRGIIAYPFGRQLVEALLGSRPASLSDRTINRDDFVAVDHGVKSVGPMLHQLGARCDQGERPDPVIDRLDTPLVQMGEAHLDHITIPQLVVVPVDLLVAESRKGASEAMGAMLGTGIIADYPQPLVERVVREGPIAPAGENITLIAGQLVNSFEDFSPPWGCSLPGSL